MEEVARPLASTVPQFGPGHNGGPCPDLDNTPHLAFSVPQFCRNHHLSTSFYYELKKEGLAPKEIRIGRKVLISTEAAADWRRDMEARSTEAAPQPEPENHGPVT